MSGRSIGPEIMRFPISQLDSFATPNDRFYIRNHFDVPIIDKDTWKLSIEGAVRNTLRLSFDDLLKLPERNLASLLECAGNSSPQLFPLLEGLPRESGLASNAEWSGVLLADILKHAGITRQAVEVVLEGADSGEIDDPRSPSGRVNYARSLPIAKALQPEVLLAYKMNGRPLPVAHGFPLRAIVPGWYGMASVKWLTRIVVTTVPFAGYFQTLDYAYWQHKDQLPIRVPIRDLQVKSVISRPRVNEVIKANTPYRIHGAAWTSDSHVVKVEISTDGGDSWSPATLLGEPVKYAWRLWEYNWHTPVDRGSRTILARATDAAQREQPMTYDSDRGGYMVNSVLPVDVVIQ